MTLTLLAGILLAIWLYLFFARGNFWWMREEEIAPKSQEYWPSVAAIVPARNEAATIASTVGALGKQDYPGKFSIAVVDDQSEDGTAGLARQAGKDCGTTTRIAVFRANGLPSGWTGKLWALREGIREAGKELPDFFWFTDADIVHAPDTLQRLVLRTQEQELDLTSLMVLLPSNTFAERLLIPAFLYFFLLLYPLRRVADPNSRTAGAAGGCILLRRSALECIGGLETIRGEVIDDCALARAVKKNGGKIWPGLTRQSVSLRSYKTFSEIREMLARTAFTQLRYSSVWLMAALAGLFVTFLLPWIVFFASNGVAWWMTDATLSLMMTTYLATIRYYRLNPLWTLTLPVAVIFYGYATCVSAVRYWLGRGGRWKGRAQAHNV